MQKDQVWATCIMVVDDNEGIRMALGDLLLALGYEVCHAANGREALGMLSLRTIDGMLVDVQMPVMDGWTMLEQLQQRHSDIPIIVMSAGAPGKIAPKAREYGAQGYLSNPFNFSNLQSACLRVFGELPAQSRQPQFSS